MMPEPSGGLVNSKGGLGRPLRVLGIAAQRWSLMNAFR